jgi:two-component system sensor histidine kinase RegB
MPHTLPNTGRQYLFNMQARGDWVRLRTLVTLRWIAIAGQIAAVLAASQGMNFQLPLAACALLISVSVMVNVIAQVIYPTEKRLTEQGTLLSLFFDLAQLVTLLMLTGGLNNPFAVLILAPVTISATALRLSSTLWLGIAAMGAVTLMTVLYLPLVHPDGTVLEVPELYRSGVAASLAIAVAFLSIYARRVTVEGYAMSQALSATQIELSREQRLAAIGGIAAATAHELGTPLATIKLVAGELARELKDRPELGSELGPELVEDIALIRREAERCGEILTDLSQGGRDDSQIRNAPVSAIIDEAAAPHRNRGKRVLIRVDGAMADEPREDEPMAARSPELIHGLRNVIQNAVDFAKITVWVDVDFNAEQLRIAVGDDGPGFAADILPRLGEPYVSTRRRGERREAGSGTESEYEGMGLGLFIARTLLERTGAQVSFANGSDARRRRSADQETPAELTHPPGAIIEMVWPASVLVTPKEVARRPLGRNQRFGAQL